MKIIYLHGFNSNGNGRTANALKEFYKEGVITPSYDFVNADKTYEEIDSLIQKFKGEQIILVGTSLGGFWANYFAERYSLPCVLANPALNPSNSLKKYIGFNKNFITNESYFFLEENANSFAKYENTNNNAEKYVLLSVKDEIIPYEPSTKVFKEKHLVIDNEEGHQIKDVSKIVSLIEKAINLYYL